MSPNNRSVSMLSSLVMFVDYSEEARSSTFGLVRKL